MAGSPAAHQRPQAFYIVTTKNRRPLRCGRVHVTFVARENAAAVPIFERTTPRGRGVCAPVDVRIASILTLHQGVRRRRRRSLTFHALCTSRPLRARCYT